MNSVLEERLIAMIEGGTAPEIAAQWAIDQEGLIIRKMGVATNRAAIEAQRAAEQCFAKSMVFKTIWNPPLDASGKRMSPDEAMQHRRAVIQRAHRMITKITLYGPGAISEARAKARESIRKAREILARPLLPPPLPSEAELAKRRIRTRASVAKAKATLARLTKADTPPKLIYKVHRG